MTKLSWRGMSAQLTKLTETDIAAMLDEEIKQFLKIADDLLGKLPDDVIDEFAQSKDFEIYERVINKYKDK